MQDPFYIVKEEVQESISTTQLLHERWMALEGSNRMQGDPEFDKVNLELKKTLRNIEWDVQDLEDTISIVEDNPRKFKLDSDEVRSRRQFVSETKEFLAKVKKDISSGSSRKRSTRNELLSGGAVGGGIVAGVGVADDRLDRAIEQDNDAFIGEENHRQTLLMHEQDEEVEDLSLVVGRLHEVGTDIKDELEVHNTMLDDLERDVDSTSGRLKQGMKKAAKVLKDAKDKGKFLFIVLLVGVLVTLVVMMMTKDNK